SAPPVAPRAAMNWGLVYRSPVLWHLAAVYAMFGFAYIIYATFFATYLTKEGGWSPAAAGGLWATIGALSIFSGFIWGAISDTIGRKYGLALVFLLQGLSILIFALFRTPAGFYLSAILFGLTAWSIPGIMAAACGDYVGPRLAPAALGLITVIFGIGQAFGPSLAGAIADSTGSFELAFIVAALAEGVGAAGALLLTRPVENL
ncbi:MAG TPA: MFS transporter, partial [Chloroflexi bacterium]|nr:MFS transporter [Chloroflexota bacterium]